MSRAAVVMITDAEIDDWATVYQEACFAPWSISAEGLPADPPLVARFAARSAAAGQGEAAVDHYLLRLPRRR